MSPMARIKARVFENKDRKSGRTVTEKNEGGITVMGTNKGRMTV